MPDSPGRVQWPRDYSGYIMWREVEPYERSVGCPLCGAAVTDTEVHVLWHEESAPARTPSVEKSSSSTSQSVTE